MSSYRVTRNLQAAVRLFEPIDVGGLAFLPQGPRQIDVTASLASTGFREAVAAFDQQLLVAMDAFTLVSGAAMSAIGASTLIEKRRSKYVYLHAVRRRPSAHLTIVRTHHQALVDQASAVAQDLPTDGRQRHSAAFLRQAAISESVSAMAFCLLQAAEALATNPGTTVTNKTTLRQVMGPASHGFFYKRDPVLRDTRRNALAHGRLIDTEGMQPVCIELQTRLLKDLRNRFHVTAQPAFTPIRGFVTFERHPLFLEPINPLPALAELAEQAALRNLHSASDPRWVGVDTSRRLYRAY